ncbi:MAG: dienelactone hydrolase family protein [Thermoleophilia bacterium]|nr:dienelactone hydrolase family protein [Thermoleophilia bacterium]
MADERDEPEVGEVIGADLARRGPVGRYGAYSAIAGAAVTSRGVQAARAGARPVAALVLHGWASDRTGSSRTVAAALARIGIPSLVPDLPGHGARPGSRDELTRAHFLTAAVDAYDELADGLEDAASTRILVVGTSFGAALAAQLAAARPVAALVLRVPADYPDAGFDDQPMGAVVGDAGAHAWRADPDEPGDTRVTRALASFAGPVLVQEAECDDVIAAPQVARLVRAAGDADRVTHELLVGAPHALSTAPEALAAANDALVRWVLRVLA